MALIGRCLLPIQVPAPYLQAIRQAEEDLVNVYRLGERLFRVRVPVGSALNGKSLAQSAFRERYNLTAVAIERNGQVTCPRLLTRPYNKVTSFCLPVN
jgi:Trk K+ transport system NAD-binding subunit